MANNDGDPVAAGDCGTGIICLSFRNTGHCRYGDKCKFQHVSGEPIASLPSWIVSNLPPHVTAHEVSLAFMSVMPLETVETASVGDVAKSACGYETVLHARGGNAARPFAHVTAGRGGVEQDASILTNGITIRGTVCSVKRRRESKVSSVRCSRHEVESEDRVQGQRAWPQGD